jgi:hypothetical protein
VCGELAAESQNMISRCWELVIVLVIVLVCVGAFLIYDSLTGSSRSGFDLEIIMGACCCSLALILSYNLVVQLRELSSESDQHQQQ